MRHALLVLFTLVGGCASNKLAHRIADKSIAGYPMIERAEALSAQDDIAQAKGELLTITSQQKALPKQRARVEEEKKRAVATEERAKAQVQRVEESRDFARKNAAERTLQIASLTVRAIEARLDVFDHRERALAEARTATARRLRASEALFEREKARLLSQKGRMAPPELAAFEAQHRELETASQAAKAEAEKKNAELAQAEERSGKAREQLETMKKGPAG